MPFSSPTSLFDYYLKQKGKSPTPEHLLQDRAFWHPHRVSKRPKSGYLIISVAHTKFCIFQTNVKLELYEGQDVLT
jgi:hypothetical protein